MAIPFLIIGAAALATAFVVGVFWQEIKSFLIKAFNYFKEILIESFIAGYKTFLQTGSLARALYGAGQVAIQKCYSKKENGKFEETIIHREISFDEIPTEFREKVKRARGQEVDITTQVAQELKLEHN